MSAQAEKEVWLPKESNAVLNDLLVSRTEIKTNEPGSSAQLHADLRMSMRNAVSITLSFLPEKKVLETLQSLSIELDTSEKPASKKLWPGMRDVTGLYCHEFGRIYAYSASGLMNTIGHEYNHRLKRLLAPEPYEGMGAAYTESAAGLQGALSSTESLRADLINRGIFVLTKLSKYPSHGVSALSFLAEFNRLREMPRSDVEERLRSILRGGKLHNHDFYDHERGYKFAALSLLAHGLGPIAALRDMVGAKSDEAIPRLAECMQSRENEFVFEELRRRLVFS